MTTEQRQSLRERLAASLNESRARLKNLKERSAKRDIGDRERRVLDSRLAALRDRGRTIRCQLRQLDGARDAAVDDLEHGLTIACERLACELMRLREEFSL
jgi:hypothetical protein